MSMHHSGENARGKLIRVIVPRHCEERELRSNPCLRLRRDGLLRFARNDGENEWAV